jgi:hypothetical protein
MKLIAPIYFFFFLHLCLNLSAEPNLQLQWGVSGLTSLHYLGAEFLARGDFLVNGVHFTDSKGLVTQGNTHGHSVGNPATQTESLTFDWGAVQIRYRTQADRLMLAIDVVNETKSILDSLSFDALALQLPSAPKQFERKLPMLGTNIGGPTLLPLDFVHGSIVLTNDDVKRPLLLGLPWSLNPPAMTVFPVRINTGREGMYPDSLPTIDRPIAPGAKDSFQISLRFSDHEANIRASANDVLKNFAHWNEVTLKWPDRRPIGALIIATAAANWKNNPRGWLLDPKIDVTTPSGVAAFHARLLQWADHSIAILKKMDAQGMITWDIEGEEFPHPTTYIGDPSLSESLAPEMAGVVDDYFRRFKNAGLRVGVTIRPQRFARNGMTIKQLEASDPAAELIRKIAFAKKRWNATLFYIDSNGDPVRPLSSEVIARVAKAFPDVLLIPEHKNVAYYSKSAPYSESRGGSYSTPDIVTAIYPRAFSVINTADGSVDKHYAELLAAVNRGDILMFRSWFDDPANPLVKAICAHSKFKAP